MPLHPATMQGMPRCRAFSNRICYSFNGKRKAIRITPAPPVPAPPLLLLTTSLAPCRTGFVSNFAEPFTLCHLIPLTPTPSHSSLPQLSPQDRVCRTALDIAEGLQHLHDS